MTIKWTYLGLTDYKKAALLQEELRSQMLSGGDSDYLLLMSHPPVITRGVSERGEQAGLLESRERLTTESIPVIDVDRGGKTTFHGPDQLVGYFIFDLKRRDMKLRNFVSTVADVVLDVLDSYGIDATYNQEDPGIVMAGKKVGFLGFSVKHHVTAHGFALNVGRDIKGFDFIVPCGKVGRVIGSLEGETARQFSMYDVYWRFVTALGTRFGEPLEEVFVDAYAMG